MSACNCPMGPPVGPTLASTCGGSAFMLFMGLLEVFLRSQCDLEDPCGRPQDRLYPDPEYDFIIVGAGTGGSVVASRLSEVPHFKVLLIEAGGEEPTGAQVPSMFLNFIGSDIDYGFLTEPEKHACLNQDGQRCYWPRGKVLGGTSVFNGMMYMRGSKTDYDKWAAAGNPGWSYDEILPYFIKSEDNKQPEQMDPGYHGVGGPLSVSHFPYHPPLSLAILKAAQEMGYKSRDLNGAVHEGFMIAQSTSRNGSRMSASKAFLRPAKDRHNLHIMMNTTVSRVLIHPRSKIAYGVEFIDPMGYRRQILTRKEVIVSGGAVSSPHILLLSGIGPSGHLHSVGVPAMVDLPGVGENLHNHVTYFTKYYINDTDTSALNWATAMEYLLFRDGLMSGTGISEITGMIKTKFANHSIDHPDVQMYFAGFLADCAKTGQVGEKNSDGRRAIQIFPSVLHPESRGRIRLGSPDPTAPPKIYANYFAIDRDMKTLIEGIKFGHRMTQMDALRPYGFQIDETPVKGCEKLPFGCDEYWECAVQRNTGPENHQAGSCKMGPSSDPMAVVDHELKVHGVRGLRVIDASIMPSVTSGNTNAPVFMIGEKGAHMIRLEWGGM